MELRAVSENMGLQIRSNQFVQVEFSEVRLCAPASSTNLNVLY